MRSSYRGFSQLTYPFAVSTSTQDANFVQRVMVLARLHCNPAHKLYRGQRSEYMPLDIYSNRLCGCNFHSHKDGVQRLGLGYCPDCRQGCVELPEGMIIITPEIMALMFAGFQGA